MTVKLGLDHRKRKVELSLSAMGTRHQTGFTLVELMISVVLGLVIIAGVLSVFTTNREAFRSNENLARMQENARTAFDLMARDLREAGANPCGTPLVANVLRVPTEIPWWADWNKGSVRGYDAGQDVTDIVPIGTAATNRATGTDSILVIRAAQDEKIVSAHDTTTFDLTVNSVTGLAANDVLIACDLNSAAIFEAYTVSPITKKINHASDVTDYNCSSNLGYPTAANCPTTAPSVKQFQGGAVVAKLVSTYWYVGIAANGKKSLFRTRITKASGHPTTTPEEILDGVKDLQIEYLTKNKTSSALATSWIPANDPVTPSNPNDVFSAANLGWTKDNVNQVVAARITLTLQSDENVGENRVPVERTLIHVVGFRGRDLLF